MLEECNVSFHISNDINIFFKIIHDIPDDISVFKFAKIYGDDKINKILVDHISKSPCFKAECGVLNIKDELIYNHILHSMQYGIEIEFIVNMITCLLVNI